MEAVQDVIAQEKIRMMIARGETVGKTFSEHNDNDIRGYLQWTHSSYNSIGSSYSISSSSNKTQAELNKTSTELILELQSRLNTYDLQDLDTCLSTVKKCLAISGNPDWLITQLFDLKKQFETRMKSIDSNYEFTIRNKKLEAERKVQEQKHAEAERVRIYNNSPEGRAVAARQKAQAQRVAEKKKEEDLVQVIIGLIIFALIAFVVIAIIMACISDQRNIAYIIGIAIGLSILSPFIGMILGAIK
jgi:hypothetical protein